MRLSLRVFFIVFFFSVISVASKAEITLKELIFDDSKPYHIKILETLPKNAIIQVGPDNAKHTVIEFFDYFCGYCKKIHPELIDLAQRRNDTRVVFLQHPILSESSRVIAEMVVAANYQDKGTELHNGLFSMSGSITHIRMKIFFYMRQYLAIIIRFHCNKKTSYYLHLEKIGQIVVSFSFHL